MLVRLEVDGFKNLLGFEAWFGPLTCVAGPNGTGKSNVFDAIRFLSLLADHPLHEAPRLVRGATGPADPEELFWTDGAQRAEVMRFAAEMLVPDQVEDDFGRPVRPTATLLRYALSLGLRAGSVGEPGRLVLLSERLSHINKGEAHRHLRFPHSASRFRGATVRNTRSGDAFISTEALADGAVAVRVHGDGGHPGLRSPVPVERAPATVVSVTTTSDRPTILAARREMQRWRRLAFEPGAMRRDDGFASPRELAEDGSRLAATLHRLVVNAGEGQGEIYDRLARLVAALAPVQGVRVVRDDHRRVFRLEAQVDDGAWLPARALSDGTLRALALGVAALDPATAGLLCIEEPENGVHPSRLEALSDHLRAMVFDPRDPPGAENPLRQIIVNTHSPALVEMQDRDDVVFAAAHAVDGPANRPTHTIVLEPPTGTWRAEDARAVRLDHAVSALRTPRGNTLQLALDFEHPPEGE